MARVDANDDLVLKDEAVAIVGAAMEVHSVLDHGFREAVYADALALKLARRGTPYQREVPIALRDKGSVLPHRYRANFLVFGQIILAPKAIKTLGDLKRAQVFRYLKATGHPLAILANFGAPKLDWMRLVLPC